MELGINRQIKKYWRSVIGFVAVAQLLSVQWFLQHTKDESTRQFYFNSFSALATFAVCCLAYMVYYSRKRNQILAVNLLAAIICAIMTVAAIYIIYDVTYKYILTH
jgi:hypothetical protein